MWYKSISMYKKQYVDFIEGRLKGTSTRSVLVMESEGQWKIV